MLFFFFYKVRCTLFFPHLDCHREVQFPTQEKNRKMEILLLIIRIVLSNIGANETTQCQIHTLEKKNILKPIINRAVKAFFS